MVKVLSPEPPGIKGALRAIFYLYLRHGGVENAILDATGFRSERRRIRACLCCGVSHRRSALRCTARNLADRAVRRVML